MHLSAFLTTLAIAVVSLTAEGFRTQLTFTKTEFATKATQQPNHLSPLRLSEESEGRLTSPTSFREAEILGLRFMQESRFQEALDAFSKGMKLPGSRKDVIRTKTLSGPSPVGGSAGGTEGREVLSLDEFELQAGHYNMACAHARLGDVAEVRVSKACLEYTLQF